MWAAIVIIIVALLLVLAAPKPKIENARAANLGDFDFPRSKEGDPVPWFRGTVRLRSPNSLWYGDYTPVPIKKKQKTGLFSSKKVTVGYKYHIGLDLCWSLGGEHTVVLRKLWSDKYVFWSGTQSVAGTLNVNLPNLFGGDEQRGGMIGFIEYYPGSFTETKSAYLASKADPDVPAYIGQCRTVFKGSSNSLASGFYFGTTTNINTINAEASCYSSDIHPTYSIMPNGLDVNPMELLYAGFTQRFGMIGTSTADIDMPSWQRDAETLYNENMGMSLLVQATITGKDLCEEVLRIADGILYQDNDTGKMVSTLIRPLSDLEIAALPIFDQSVVDDLANFTKTTWAQAYNQCRVTFKDRSNEYADRVAIQQDFALINFQQKVRNTDISVPGCFVNAQATQLASRQLSLMSVPLFQIEIRCNRKASLIKPGQCFKFNWAPYGLSNMIMRVQKIDKGTLTNGDVTIHAVQDRFATALAVFAPPTGSGWTPINTDAAPVAVRRIDEVPFWFSQFADVAPANDQGMLMIAAVPPTGSSVEYDVDITTNADSGWTNPTRIMEDAPYYGTGQLTAAYPSTAGRTSGTDATGFTLESLSVPSELIDSGGAFDATGQMLLLVDNEFMSAADMVNNGNGTYTFTGIRRALLDTDFETHALGARVYLIKQADGLIEGYVNDASTWRLRLLDNTPNSTLDPAAALTNTVAMTRRMFRPAPPDYLTLNGSRTLASAPTAVNIALAIRERNRKTLTLTPYDAATQTVEAGQDNQVRTRMNAGAWSSPAFFTGTTYTIPGASLIAPGLLEVEVSSRRDTLLSRTADIVSTTLVDVVPTGDAAAVRAAILAPSPLFYLRHGEASGAVATNEVAGTNGTYVSAPPLAQPVLYINGLTTVRFGSSKYATMPNTIIPVATALSGTIIIKPLSVTGFQGLISRDNGSQRYWQWRLSGTSMEFIKIVGGIQSVTKTAVVSLGVNCVLGFSLDAAGNIKFYYNGAVIHTAVIAAADYGGSTGNIELGYMSGGGGSPLEANTGESAIYNVALSDAQHLAISQAAGFAP